MILVTNYPKHNCTQELLILLVIVNFSIKIMPMMTSKMIKMILNVIDITMMTTLYTIST
jgi:hypothetical protein